ncbi:hypothetical protein EPH_0002570 [Eimeria praecox]|uniref:CCHC-type domain-containing protein n=1 Tax=Eimeria praecox TaxID=51316 RepID=U6G2K1_9EIME|nr:hypothetical protein EPH_0002570 [Eimeria praecox]
MQPQEQQPNEIAKLRQEVEQLQNYLLQMSVQLSSLAPPPPIPREKGNNVQPFLMLMEQRFKKMALPQELWGDELGEYLDEDALQYWMDLKQSANALAAIAAPWAAAQEDFRRWEGEFQLSLAGRAAAFPRAPVSNAIRRYTQASGGRTEIVCYQCKGKGHMAKNSPTGDPKLRKSGKTYRNCGGMGHYAADTMDVLAARLIRYHGLPEALISDRDPRFQSDLWQ